MASGGETQAHRSRVSDVGQEPLKMLMPIRGYGDVPLMTLEKAVEPLVKLVSDIQDYVYVAKQRCDDEPADGLSRDESAAIMLYSMEWTPREKCLYFVLNSLLRCEDRRKLEPWFPYLKLFLSGLTRLPSAHRFVYRGVKLDLSKYYTKGKLIVWWALSSCTSSVEVLQNEDFLGQTGARTLFNIECNSGKDIRRHSYFQFEEEILLPPARQFEVVSSLQMGPDVHVIQLKEVKPPIELLQPISLVSHTKESISVNINKDNPNPIHVEQVNKQMKHMKLVQEPSSGSAKKEVPEQFKSIQSKPVTIVLNPTCYSIRSGCVPNIPVDASWSQSGITVAGGNGMGSALNQLNGPYGVYVDNDLTVYVADTSNNRIVEWKSGATTGRVVIGEHGKGNEANQLDTPFDMILDQATDSFIICDTLNRRVLRWPRKHATNGETLIDKISCSGLTMADNRNLYVSDWNEHAVRQYKVGEMHTEVVAGGNGVGSRLNQLQSNMYIFVNQDYSVYISDYNNHRVMKWLNGKKEGIVVAGGQGQGDALTQLSHPQGICVDRCGTVYVADYSNHRVMRWPKGATEGNIIVGGKQLCAPRGLSFDKYGNLYVVDWGNNRIQLFPIET